MPQFPTYLSKEKQDELRQTANAIVAPGKGILAADESTGQTITLITFSMWCREPLIRSLILNQSTNFVNILYSTVPAVGVN